MSFAHSSCSGPNRRTTADAIDRRLRREIGRAHDDDDESLERRAHGRDDRSENSAYRDVRAAQSRQDELARRVIVQQILQLLQAGLHALHHVVEFCGKSKIQTPTPRRASTIKPAIRRSAQ